MAVRIIADGRQLPKIAEEQLVARQALNWFDEQVLDRKCFPLVGIAALYGIDRIGQCLDRRVIVGPFLMSAFLSFS